MMEQQSYRTYSQTYIKRVYRYEPFVGFISPNYKDIFLSNDEDPRIVGIMLGILQLMRLNSSLYVDLFYNYVIKNIEIPYFKTYGIILKI